MLTTSLRFTPLALALALSLAACSASSEDTAVSTGADQAGDHARHIEAVASKEYGDQVTSVFGRFVRGEAALYRGTFAAHDNQGAVEGGGDGDIPSQAATATLGMEDGNLTFHVVSASKRHVDFVQSSAGTMVSIILFDGQNGGLLAQCKDCIPALGTQPQRVTLDHVETDGHFFDAASTPFAITTSADLAKVPVSGITYSDLETTNAAFGFTPDGSGTLVRHVEDMVDEDLETKPGMYRCWLRTSYSLDQWVSPTDITKYGVRDFKVDSISMCCLSPGVCAGGGACAPPTQTKSFTTGVGASVTATTNTQIISADGKVERTLAVSYDDTGAYFGGQKDLRAVAIVHRQGVDSDESVTLKWSLANGKGTVTLPDAALITKIEFAFSNAAGSRWDSNESKNYAISF